LFPEKLLTKGCVAGVLLLLFGMQAAHALPTPIAYFPMENSPNDSTGNITTTSVSGSPQYITGIKGDAIQLAISEHVVLADSTQLLFGTSQDFSVSLWIRTDGFSSDPSIISNKDWDSGTNAGWIIAALNGSWKWNIGPSRVDFSDSSSITDSQWHMITVTHDRNGSAALYFDGVQQGTANLSGASRDVDAGLSTVLGQDGTTSYSGDFAFDADEIYFFDVVLSVQDVVDLYVDANGPFCPGGSTADISGPDGDPDCLVNLYDFAALASEWMDCGLSDQGLCP